MKRNILNFVFIAGIVLALFSCIDVNVKMEKKVDKGSVSESDSLANQPITETKVTPELLWKFGRVSETKLSPDGKTVIFTVKRYNIKTNKSSTDIFSILLNDGKTKQLTNFDAPKYNIRFSPDGKKIGFISSENETNQIWEINLEGDDKTMITNIKDGINSFEYSPKGNKIYYCKDVKLEKTPTDIYADLPLANVKIIDNLMYRHWNAWSDYAYSHIFVANYSNNITEGKDILEGEQWDSPLSPYFDEKEISWSPDGKFIAYTCKKMKGKEYAISTNSDIYLYNLETGKTENITEGMEGYDKFPVFSTDGKKIAWQSMKTPGCESDKDRLFVMDLATKQKEDLTEKFDESVSNVIWSKDDSKIYFISGINATYQIYKIDTKTKEIVQITKGIHDYQSFNIYGSTIIGERMSMSMATEIFKVDEQSGNEAQLSFVNKNIYDKVKMGNAEERWIKTTDNKKMLVWIIYPPDFDKNKKYPAILYCQGGPQSAVSQFFSFRWNFQIMAANQYIIIAPNRRGLPTFGSEWNAQISGDYGGQNMKDYLSAVDEMKKESFIDGNRIGCVGASYGGFSAFWLAGHHQKRFKAFIAHCGMFNLESQYAETEEVFFTNHDLGGAFWEKNNKTAQNSYANSPHRFVQNWDTPILIITGGYDFRIPYTESLQAFNCAQLRGIPSKLLFFPEESHFVLKPQNSILWQREFFAWLDKWLK